VGPTTLYNRNVRVNSINRGSMGTESWGERFAKSTRTTFALCLGATCFRPNGTPIHFRRFRCHRFR
jgi:hypothetical protein